MPTSPQRVRRDAKQKPAPTKSAKPVAHHRLHAHVEQRPVASQPVAFTSDEVLLAEWEPYILYLSCNQANKYGLREEDAHDMAQAARVRLYQVPQAKRHPHMHNGKLTDPTNYLRVLCANAMATERVKILKLKNRMVPIDPHWYIDAEPGDVSETRKTDPIDTLEADVRLEADAITRDRKKQAHNLLALLTAEEQLVITLHICPPPGERAIRDMRTLSKRSMVREARLPAVIASAMKKMREAAGVVAP